MDSPRQLKFARLVQKELAEIFQRQVPHLLPGGMISVREVRVSPDLSVARVFLSFLVVPDPAELLARITESKSVIRRHLGQRIGKNARIVPDLQFFHDDSAAYAARMDQLFNSLDIKPADDDEAEEN